MKTSKAIKIVNTGIIEEWQVVNPPNKRELEAIRKWYKEFGSLEGQIAFYENLAHGILAKHGIRDWPTSATVPDTDPMLIAVMRKHMEAMARNPGDHVLREAGLILCRAHSLRQSIAAGNIEHTAMHALQLATMGIRLEIRQHEKPAVIGRKVSAGGKKGRAAIGGRYDVIHQKHEVWRDLAENMRGTARQIAHRIARQTGDRFETIRRALRNNPAK